VARPPQLSEAGAEGREALLGLNPRIPVCVRLHTSISCLGRKLALFLPAAQALASPHRVAVGIQVLEQLVCGLKCGPVKRVLLLHFRATEQARSATATAAAASATAATPLRLVWAKPLLRVAEHRLIDVKHLHIARPQTTQEDSMDVLGPGGHMRWLQSHDARRAYR